MCLWTALQQHCGNFPPQQITYNNIGTVYYYEKNSLNARHTCHIEMLRNELNEKKSKSNINYN